MKGDEKMSEIVLVLSGETTPLEQSVVETLLEYYGAGTEVYGIFHDKFQILSLVEAIDVELTKRNLARDGMDLVPFHTQEEAEMEGNHFFFFHGSFHLWDVPYPGETQIVNSNEIATVLPLLEKYKSTFDVSQFYAVIDPQEHNILVEGIGGTGKTRTLLRRFLFLWKNSELHDGDFFDTTKIVVSHHAQKRLYAQFLEKDLENCFLLTGEEKYSRMRSAVHKIEFYTMQTLIEEALLLNGENFQVIEELDLLKKIITQTTELFIVKNSEKLTEMQELNLTFSEVEAHLLMLVTKIYEENLDLEMVTSASFGALNANDPFCRMKELYHQCVPEIARLWKESLISLGKIHRTQVISHFIHSETRVGTEKTLLIDDLHLLNDGEIEAIFSYVNRKETLLYVCQNRAETKFVQVRNRFFQCFFSGNQVNLWHFFTLKNQYRMDKELFKIFQTIFLAENRIVSLQNYNGYLAEHPSKYYHSNVFFTNQGRKVAIYDEIQRIKRRKEYERKQGKNKLKPLNTFAIVVDNQEEVVNIVEEFREFDIFIHSFHWESRVLTDLKILLNALLYYDDANAVYQLLRSSFFDCSITNADLYLLQVEVKSEEKSVCDYLQSIISSVFSEITGETAFWEEIQEKIFGNVEYLRQLYMLTTPWLKIEKSEQGNYKENLEYLWAHIENEGFLSINELHDSVTQLKITQNPVKIPDYEGLELHCLTVKETVGLEFDHILYLCSHLTMDAVSLVQNSPPLFAYQFALEWENQAFNSEFYSQIILKIEEKRGHDLYFLLSKCQFSFSWLSISGEKKFKDEEFLERGFGNYGV